jgi:hypothetical protein
LRGWQGSSVVATWSASFLTMVNDAGSGLLHGLVTHSVTQPDRLARFCISTSIPKGIRDAVFVPPFDELLDARDAVLAKRNNRVTPSRHARSVGTTGVRAGQPTLATAVCGGSGSNTGIMVVKTMSYSNPSELRERLRGLVAG